MAERVSGPEPADTTGDSTPRPVMRVLQALAVAVLAALIAVFVWRVVDQGRGGELVADVRRGDKPLAPSFELPVIWDEAETWPPAARKALADGEVSLSELRGHPIVLNFWASWCVPCKAEAPRLAAAARRYAGRVIFLGIDIQDFKSDARRFLRRYEANYVSVRDGGSSTYDAYGLTGVPETFYLDRGGRIIAHSLGEVSEQDLAEGIAAAISG